MVTAEIFPNYRKRLQHKANKFEEINNNHEGSHLGYKCITIC